MILQKKESLDSAISKTCGFRIIKDKTTCNFWTEILEHLEDGDTIMERLIFDKNRFWVGIIEFKCFSTKLSIERSVNFLLFLCLFFHNFKDILGSLNTYRSISVIVRVVAKGPGDRGLTPGRIMPKTQKMVLDASLLNIQNYEVRFKDKWSNPGKRVSPSPTHRCNSYWKGSLRVTLDYGWPTYIHTYQYT